MTPTQKLDQLRKDVTRFLVNPGTRVSHPTLDFDLQVDSAELVDGSLLCRCSHPEHGGLWTFALADLFPGGPVSEAIRAILRRLIDVQVEHVVATVRASGEFNKLELPERPPGAVECPACNGLCLCGSCGGTGWYEPSDQLTIEPFDVAATVAADNAPGVDHLQAHAEYVMGPDGPGTTPVKLPSKPEPHRDLPQDGV